MKFLVLVFLVGLFGSPVLAQEQVKVVGKIIPQVFTAQPDSIFQIVLARISERTGLEMDIEVFPGKRAITLFNGGYGDVFFPAQVELIDRGIFSVSVLPSDPVLDFQRFIYVKSGRLKLSSVKDLAGKRMGLVRGYSYGPEIDQSQDFLSVVYANDVAQLIKMVNRDRIDAFIAFPNSVYRLLAQGTEKPPVRDASSPVSRNRIIFAFQDNDKGRRLRRTFAQAISQMNADGSLQKLLFPFEPELDKSSLPAKCFPDCGTTHLVCADFRTCLAPSLRNTAHF